MSGVDRPRLRQWGLIGWIGWLVLGAGCAPKWYFSYTEAEQERTRERQRWQNGRDMLLFYKDHLDANSGRMQDVLQSPMVQPLQPVRQSIQRSMPRTTAWP